VNDSSLKNVKLLAEPGKNFYLFLLAEMALADGVKVQEDDATILYF